MIHLLLKQVIPIDLMLLLCGELLLELFLQLKELLHLLLLVLLLSHLMPWVLVL